MFITKSHHKEVVRALEDCMHLMRLGHVAETQALQARISDLSKLVFAQSTPAQIPDAEREVDAIVSASDKPISVSDEEHNRLLEEARHVDLMFSGNYDEDLLN